MVYTYMFQLLRQRQKTLPSTSVTILPLFFRHVFPQLSSPSTSSLLIQPGTIRSLSTNPEFQFQLRQQHPLRLRNLNMNSISSYHSTTRPLWSSFPPLARRTGSIRQLLTSLGRGGRIAPGRTAPHQIRHGQQANNSSSPSPSPPTTSESITSISLSARLRKLSREYGWSALGVYLLLSALDFPLCFAAVRLLGAERIGHYEQAVIGAVKKSIPWPFSDVSSGADKEDGHSPSHSGSNRNEEDEKPEGWEKEEVASIWTQLALAYAVHKSLIFIRVPLTAAVTPKVVKTLRQWGWDLGKRKPKSA